jgi:hypothetical protein
VREDWAGMNTKGGRGLVPGGGGSVFIGAAGASVWAIFSSSVRSKYSQSAARVFQKGEYSGICK